MKKLDLSNIQAGVRKLGAVKQLFEHMEGAYVDIMAELVKGLLAGTATPVALHGCINSGSGANYNINAGAIWNNGELYTIAAFVGVAPGGQVPVLNLVTSTTQLAYTDNTNQNTLLDRYYVWVFGAPDSGLCDFGNLGRMATIINNTLLDVDGQIAALVAAAPGALDTLDELAAALGDDANFASTVTNSIATKVAKAGDVITGTLEVQGGYRTKNSGPYLKTEVLQIGDFDMTAGVGIKDVSIGAIDYKKVRSIGVIIRDDTDTVYLTPDSQSGPGTPDLEVRLVAGNVRLMNMNISGGLFGTTDYNATGYNRGWVTITYEV